MLKTVKPKSKNCKIIRNRKEIKIVSRDLRLSIKRDLKQLVEI